MHPVTSTSRWLSRRIAGRHPDHDQRSQHNPATSPRLSPRSLENGDGVARPGIELCRLPHNANPNLPVDSAAAHSPAELAEIPPTPAATLPRLQRLPPELRNLIYDLALPHGQHILPHTYKPKAQNDFDHVYRPAVPITLLASVPALLQTCRLIREDAYPLYLARNTFVLNLEGRGRYGETRAWLRGMDARHLFYVRSVIVQGGIACSRVQPTAKHVFAAKVRTASSPVTPIVEGRGGERIVCPADGGRYSAQIEEVLDGFVRRHRSGDEEADGAHRQAEWIAAVGEVRDVLDAAGWRCRGERILFHRYSTPLFIAVLGAVVVSVITYVSLIEIAQRQSHH
ncbi:hypothetical protein B0A55_02948 [Friedmanniomyces simplex]|uniref:2EXR domain-containing protein n=1 Tax=Friedmanniomyces simplex TaxID=329884 RepID=A0A4U0Y281_9PEZI|nr:hypothetical protein B0A55_02948 [Friedmanniomyces simplex]